MNDFLSQFQKTAFQHSSTTKDGNKQKVLFRLSFDRGATVTVVNEMGNPITPNFKLYQGETFNVLRILDTIQQEQAMRISWDTDLPQGIRLHDYPYLTFALLRCNNLVDDNLHPIKVTDTPATVVLKLQAQQQPLAKKGAKDATTASESNEQDSPTPPTQETAKHESKQAADRVATYITPSFYARQENQPPLPFQLLSDVFALIGDTICPIPSLGENYQRLDFFGEPFPPTLLEQYLSVFYSYIDNVELDYDDYLLVRSQQNVETIPTIIIEKVDADMALYLRLASSLPGIDADFAERFDLTWLATLTMEHQVLLRRITHTDTAQDETALKKTITSYAPSRTAAKDVWSDDGEFIIPQDVAGPFLLGALPQLVKRFQLLGAERLKEYKVKPIVPKMQLRLSSGIDFLEGQASISLDGEEMSLRKFLQQYGKQKYVTLSDGQRGLVDEHYVRRLERIFRKVDKGDKVKVSFFDLPEIESLLEERLEGKTFEHYREFYEGFNKLAGQRLLTPGVKAKLRNYQKEGVKWINYLYDNHFGGCLADDMGLGKTLQTITMLTRIYHTKSDSPTPSLIIMPRSLLFNWQDELHKFAPQLTYYTYYGQQRDMQLALQQQLILTTYALVRNDIEQFRQQQFHYIILDESQNIKNLQSQTTQAVLLLNGEHRLALSGTPIENNLTELYSLYRFLNPAMLGSLDDFNRQYAIPIQHQADKEATEALRRKIFPFMLRRLKKDVLKELPDRMEQTLYVEMEPDHERFYDERRQYYQQAIQTSIKAQGLERSQMMMFQALSELRRIASVPESLSDGAIPSPKLPLLAEQVEEAVAGGHKVVVFFNFIAGIELFGERLTEMGIDYATMTGSTRDRRSVVERFQNDPGCRALLMTLKTGGVGLNLTVADTVYIVEPWWNKAAEEQAINRLHRIGQKAKVMSYALITRNTIEEKIRLLQQQKQDLADSLITGDQAITKRLTEEDINYIFDK